jgi:hypothetical protein
MAPYIAEGNVMARTAADLSDASAGTETGRSPLSPRTIVLLAVYFIVLWALTAAGRYVPNVARQDRFEDDAQQHVWWAYQYANPALYPHDEMLRFMSGPPCAPIGYKALYQIFTPHFDAQRFSESVPFVLSALLMVVALLVGYRVGGGPAAAIVLGIVITDRYYLDHLQGGFPRSYGLLIMLFAMWALMARRLVWLGVAFLAAGLFYPPALVPPAMCAFVALGWDTLKTKKLPKDWIPLGLMTAAAVVMMLVFMKGLPPEFGPVVTAEQARTMPEFQPEARAEYFGQGWRDFIFENPLSGFGQPMPEVLKFFGLIVLSVVLFRNFMPREGWFLLIGSLLSFIAAHILIFKMHVPNRHVQYPLVVFRLIWIAALVKPIVDLSTQALRRVPAVWNARGPIVAVILVAVLIGIGTSSIKRMTKELHAKVNQDEENAFAFIRSLPPDVLVAAHPYDADKIPLRTQHSVLAMWETYHPYWMGYYHYIQPRVEASLYATYASDWNDLAKLNTQYGVGVFLVNEDRYWDNHSIWFCRPYTPEAVRLVEIGREKGFALLNAPQDRVLYRSGRMSVVKISP